VRRNLWPLVASYLPGALIADRTALENRPAPTAPCFSSPIINAQSSCLGGLTSPPRPSAVGERPALHWRTAAGFAREGISGKHEAVARPRERCAHSAEAEIEERLDEMLRRGGEAVLQRLRDDARDLATQLGLPGEFQRLDALIGALLGSRDARLSSPPRSRAPQGCPTIRSGSICFSACMPHWPVWRPRSAWRVPRTALPAFLRSLFLQLHRGH